ncbi:MAG: FliH/SctL family protein [Bdellovibrionota bacterium]
MSDIIEAVFSPYQTNIAYTLELEHKALKKLKLEVDSEIKCKRSELARKVFKLKNKVSAQATKKAQTELVKQLLDGFKSIETLKEKLLKEAEAECLSLSISIAKELVSKELKIDSKLLEQRLNNCLSSVFKDDIQKIFFSSEDYKQITSTVSDSSYEFLENPELAQGDLIIATQSGQLEFKIDDHLDQIYSIMKERLYEL